VATPVLSLTQVSRYPTQRIEVLVAVIEEDFWGSLHRLQCIAGRSYSGRECQEGAPAMSKAGRERPHQPQPRSSSSCCTRVAGGHVGLRTSQRRERQQLRRWQRHEGGRRTLRRAPRRCRGPVATTPRRRPGRKRSTGAGAAVPAGSEQGVCAACQ
jgi:hypothetical protein